MGLPVSLRKNELNRIDQQLSVLRHKVSEMERRRTFLRNSLQDAGYGYDKTTALVPVNETHLIPDFRSVLSTENVVEFLRKVNAILRFISDLIIQAEKYIHGFASVIGLLEQGGPGLLKQLTGAVGQYMLQPVNPPAALRNEESRAGGDIDTQELSQLFSEFLQTPFSQQLLGTLSSK